MAVPAAEGTNPPAGDTSQTLRRGSTASGAGSGGRGPPENQSQAPLTQFAAPPPPPPLSASNRGLPSTPKPASTSANPTPGGDPQSTPLPPSPGPAPPSKSSSTYPSAAQEKAQLAAANRGALNSPQSGGSNAPQVVPAPKVMPGAFTDAESSAPPPPSYGESGAAGGHVPQAVYQSNLASPGPGHFYFQTQGGFVPLPNPPPPGINLFVLGADGNFYPAPITTGSPPGLRSPHDYFNNKESKTPLPRSARPASISYDPSRGGPQKATRQSSYPLAGHADDDADPDDELRSSAAAANKYVKRSRDLGSRMDEDDDDFNPLKPDEHLAKRLEQQDRFDEEDEDDFDDLPDHPPGYHKPPPKRGPKPLFFYEETEKYYEFTNFAPYPVVFRGKEYPTSEHLFQARKFLDHRPLLAEHIRRGSDRPRFAFNEARRFAPETRPDWKENSITIMEEILELKFTQHAKLRRLLLETRDRYLVENLRKSTQNARQYDDFWGNGADGNGRNELGKALMRLRDTLREKEKETFTNTKGKGKLRR
ncbi:hypothetical protein FRC05_011606 [Tulasnella sp. 425]|nr:hypothetical protein FRC05_011606 [Tulasnella sp. 425]